MSQTKIPESFVTLLIFIWKSAMSSCSLGVPGIGEKSCPVSCGGLLPLAGVTPMLCTMCFFGVKSSPRIMPCEGGELGEIT